jgi:uncharacterized membrane protein YidH (DUF202 family)
MNKAISVALLAGGIVLVILGYFEYDSTSSDISRFFTGSATDKSIWMIVGGVVVAALGLTGLFRNLRSN